MGGVGIGGLQADAGNVDRGLPRRTRTLINEVRIGNALSHRLRRRLTAVQSSAMLTVLDDRKVSVCFDLVTEGSHGLLFCKRWLQVLPAHRIPSEVALSEDLVKDGSLTDNGSLGRCRNRVRTLVNTLLQSDDTRILDQFLVLADHVDAALGPVEAPRVELSSLEWITITTFFIALVIQAYVLPIDEVVEPAGLDLVGFGIVVTAVIVQRLLLFIS